MYRNLFVLLPALAFSLGGASDGALDRATLRGVTAVNVVIDPVGPDVEKEGATAGALRSRIEDRLRASGIRVDSASHEFVALRLTSVRAAKGPLPGRQPFAIAVSIGLYQPVTLARDSNVKTATQTWEVDTVLLADTKEVFHACMDTVDDLAKRFVEAYHSVNQ
jgi:hypothetical protein